MAKAAPVAKMPLTKTELMDRPARPAYSKVKAWALGAIAAAWFVCMALPVVAAADGAGSIVPARLRCEQQDNPIGLDAARPRLSWICQAAAPGRRGLRQTAFQVLAASSQAGLQRDEGDLWDSGKVASDESILVNYAGQPWRARQQCFWKVRLWDQDGRMSPWSGRPRFAWDCLRPATGRPLDQGPHAAGLAALAAGVRGGQAGPSRTALCLRARAV